MDAKTADVSLSTATARDLIDELMRRDVSFVLITKENEPAADSCLNAHKVIPQDRAWMITALIDMLKNVDGRAFEKEKA